VRFLPTLAIALFLQPVMAVGVASAAKHSGSASADTLTGTEAADVLVGKGGRDDLYGAGGADALNAGDEGDQLLGGSGSDLLSAGAGRDHVHADDGVRDLVSCGGGTDTFFADRYDVVVDCEVDGKAALRGGALATFDVVGERFRAWITKPSTIWELRQLAAGDSAANIPSGTLKRSPGRAASNTPYSWHLDPSDTAMGEMAIEVCDATPSYVERHRDEFVDIVRAYCPWGARLVELRNYRGRVEAPSSTPPDPVEFPDEG
jgi:RTX calcium-binding nonapeptide repeat (4 copies)